jgi:hypothetical protein
MPYIYAEYGRRFSLLLSSLAMESVEAAIAYSHLYGNIKYIYSYK